MTLLDVKFVELKSIGADFEEHQGQREGHKGQIENFLKGLDAKELLNLRYLQKVSLQHQE